MEDRSSLLKSMREALGKLGFDSKSDAKNQLSFSTMLLSLFWIALLFVIFLSAFGAKAATVSGSQTITLDGRLTDSSGNNPLLDSSVVIDVKIYNPAATCVLYEEHQTVNTTSSDGRFTILVGSATGSSKRTGSDVGNPMVAVFANNQAIAGSCGIYTPSAGDTRLMRVTVAPSTTGSTDVLSPDTILDQVPLALVAESLQGLDRDHVLAIDSSTTLNQTNVANIFSSTNYPILTSLLAGTNSQYVSSSASGGAKIPSVSAAPTSPVAGQIWFNSSGNSFQYFNGSSVQTIGTSGAGISSLTVGSNLTAGGTAGGTLNGPGTIDIVNSGVTAGSYSKVTVNGKGLVTAGTTLAESDIPNLTTAGKVSGSAITSGTIGGNTTFYSSGNVTASIVSSGQSITRQIQLFDPANGSSHKITILAPTLTQDYSLVFPATAGSAGYALTTDGNGNLSWASSSAGSVTSVGLSLPSIFSTTTPTVTSSGTLTAALTNQNANLIFAGPSTGSASAPTFRNLTIADLPAGYDASVLKTSLASGKIWIGNASNLANAVTPFGDVTLSLAGSGTVTGLQGYPVSATVPTSNGQVLRWNGSAWTPNSLAMSDLRSTITGTSALTSCASNQTLVFNSVTDSLLCSNISIASNQVTWASTGANLVFASPNGSSGNPVFRGIAAADLPLSGVSAGTYKSVTTDTYGRITAGTNPTTLTGFGITDAVQNLGGSPAMQSGTDSAKPVSPQAGTVYFANDTKTIYQYSSGSWLQLASNAGSGGTLNSLAGDVTTTGSGNVTASVILVGGSSANAVHTAEQLANNATSLNAINQIVKRDGSGNFNAGSATLTSANLNTLILKDSGSNAITLSAPGTVSANYALKFPNVQGSATQNLANDGSGNLSWVTPSSTATSYSGILPTANGGTGTSTPPNIFGVMYAMTSSGFATTNAGTAGLSLISNGLSSAPTFSQVPLATGISGILPVANGGTNAATTSAGFIFAGPVAASGAPAFRALASSDLPVGSTTQWINNGTSIYYSSGNVGIGTSSPNGAFEVSSGGVSRLLMGSGIYDGLIIGQRLNNDNFVELGFGSVNNKIESSITSNDLRFFASGAERMRINSSGNIGIGITAPTAKIHLAGGSAASGTAPLKFTSGSLLTTSEPGAVEFDGTSIYYTDSTSTRKALGTAGAGIAQLIGDVTASGNGSATATVQLVGGSSANAVHTAELLANAATNLNTPTAIVKRDASGNFVAGAANLTSANVSSVVYKDSGSNTVTVSAPTTIGTSYAVRWPSSTGLSNQVMQTDGSGNLSWMSPNSGSVTSVGLSLPSIFSVTTPVVTSSGTLTAALTNQNANLIFAAPSTGNGQPSFRNFVATDLPLSGVSTGTYSGLTVDSYGRVTNAATLTTLSGYGITDAVKNLGSAPGMQSGTDSAKPVSPQSGTVYFATDTKTIYEYSSGAWLQLASNAGSGGTLNSLSGDVTTTGSGNATASVILVGGSSANAVHMAELLANAATSSNTPNTIIKRDASGNFAAGTATLTSASLNSLNYKNGSFAVSVSASPSLASNYSVVWPSSQGSAQQVMQTDGSGNLSWMTPSSVATSYSGVLPVGNGGTGTLTPPNQYGVIFASTSSGYASTAPGATGLPLLGQGASAPIYSALSLSGSGVSGLLPVAAGGTNTATTTAGYIFAGPATGGAAAPSFRAIASTDLPVGGYDTVHFKQGGNSFAAPAVIGTIDANSLTVNTSNAARMTITSSGNVGVGVTSPTARLMLAPGTAIAGSSPLKLTSGTVLASPEPGSVEFDGTNLYFTDSGSIRRTLGFAGSGIAQLIGDVTASGNGSATATVQLVGGSSANAIHTAELLANAATNLNTASTIVKRDVSGSFIAGTANLTSANVSSVVYKGGANTVTVSASPSLTANYSVVWPTAQGSASQIMQTDGSGNLSWMTPSTTATSYSGVLPVGNGGTGTSTPPTQYGVIYASTSSGYASTVPGATGLPLLGQGASAPVFGALSLSGSSVSGLLPVANGGTNTATATAGYIFAGPATGGAAAPSFRAITSTDLPLGTSTQWIANGNNIYYSSGNVGVGTSNPSALMQVVSNSPDASTYPSIRINNSNSSFGDGSGSFNEASVRVSAGGGVADGEMRLTAETAGPLQSGMYLRSLTYIPLIFSTNSIESMRIDTSGNIGIGTKAPLAILDVNGTGSRSAMVVPRDTTVNRPAGVNGMIRYNTSLSQMEMFASGNWSGVAAGSSSGSYLPLTGGTLTGNVIYPYGTVSAPSISLADGVTGLYGTGAGNLSFATNGVQRMALSPGGYVGIGTNTPNTNIAGLGTAVDIYNNLTNDTAVGNALNVYATTSSNKSFSTSLSAGNFQLDIGSINYPLFASAVIGLAKNGNNVQTVNGGTFTATSTTGYPTYLSGVSGTANVSNNSTIANVSGGRFAAGVTSGSTATKALGLYSTVTGPGSITNGYGLYVDTVLGTNKFGVYENSGGTNYFAGNIGVGTSSPQAILDLVGSATTNSALIVPRATIAQRPTTAVNGMIRYATDTNSLESYINGSWTNLSTAASGASQWSTSGTTIYYTGGSVGIGTNSVGGNLLQVNGQFSNNGNAYIGSGSGQIIELNSNSSNASYISLRNGGTPVLHIPTGTSANAGNVGIGTTTPSYALDVNGVFRANSTATSVFGNGTSGSIQIGDQAISKAFGSEWNWPGSVKFPGSSPNGVLQVTNSGSGPTAFFTGGYVGVGTASPNALLDIFGTGTSSAVLVPRDTTLNRPAGVNGMIRYNTTTAALEGYANGTWTSLSGSGSNQWFTSGSNIYYNVASGNVGIGTTTPNSALQTTSFATGFAAKSASYTLTSNDSAVFANTSSSAVTMTLPSAVGITGRQYTIKKTDGSSNSVTIGTTSSQTIDGNASYSISSQYQFVTVISDGSNWGIIGGQTNSVAFALTNISGAATGTLTTSSTVTSAGSGSSTLSISGSGNPQLSINGGAWSSTGLIAAGQSVAARLTTGSGSSTTFTANISGASSPITWSVTTAASLYAFSSQTFTNCGQTGKTGPSLSQCQSAYSSAPWSSNSSFFNVTAGIQSWTVPADGTYRIIISGAQGGNGGSGTGGYGATVQGDFNFTMGQVIKILVGQTGGNQTGGSFGACGGGGSFVTTNSNSALIVAAGGQGSTASSAATAGVGSYSYSTQTPSDDGGSGRDTAGGPGAGFQNNGHLDPSASNQVAALSFLNGGTGGSGSGCSGGFGGGGGHVNSNTFGSGAGGFTGGDEWNGSIPFTNSNSTTYTTYGNGMYGGSFNSGNNPTNVNQSNSGQGSVSIQAM